METDYGDWYFPNGDRLKFNGDHVDICEVRKAHKLTCIIEKMVTNQMLVYIAVILSEK